MLYSLLTEHAPIASGRVPLYIEGDHGRGASCCAVGYDTRAHRPARFTGASTSEIQRPGRSSLEKKDLGSGQYGGRDSSIAALHDLKQTAIQPDQSRTLDRPTHMTAKESNWKSLLYSLCSVSFFTQTSAKRTCLSDWRLRTSSVNSAPP